MERKLFKEEHGIFAGTSEVIKLVVGRLMGL